MAENSVLDVTQYEPSKETLPVPPELFPIIEAFPLGSLVLINTALRYCNGDTIDAYLTDLKIALPNSPVIEMRTPHLVNQETLQAQREWVREQRYEALRSRRVTFLIQRGQIQDTLEQEADYSFYLHQGRTDSLLVELGKAREARIIVRKFATVYTKQWKPTPQRSDT